MSEVPLYSVLNHQVGLQSCGADWRFLASDGLRQEMGAAPAATVDQLLPGRFMMMGATASHIDITPAIEFSKFSG
jgi:hypothetical protein